MVTEEQMERLFTLAETGEQDSCFQLYEVCFARKMLLLREKTTWLALAKKRISFAALVELLSCSDKTAQQKAFASLLEKERYEELFTAIKMDTYLERMKDEPIF